MTTDATLHTLLERLWQQYILRVEYARRYKELVEQKGGRVINDHIALRTFNTDTGKQPAGVEACARVFEPLGYVRKEKYDFPIKKLTAWHWEHPEPEHPKIFISQLEVTQLPDDTQALIHEAVADTKDTLTMTDPASFFSRPWAPPKRSTVEKVNEASQYAAWTLLHGNAVNHFTAYINHQQVAEWPDIMATIKGLRDAGIPMKDEIEGEPGSKLVQSSTKAVMEECDVMEEDGSIGKINWSYAYYELAERNPVDGKLFTGFLGEQATHLFDMTKTGG